MGEARLLHEEHDAVLLGERVEDLAYDACAFSIFHIPIRLRNRRGQGDALRVLLEQGEPASGDFRVIASEVRGHLEKPRARVGVVRSVFHPADERFLGDIRREVRVAGEANEIRVKLVVVKLEQTLNTQNPTRIPKSGNRGSPALSSSNTPICEHSPTLKAVVHSSWQRLPE